MKECIDIIFGGAAGMEIVAKDIMTKDVKTVNEDTPISDVIEILVANNISGVPVLNDDGKIVGIITEADLIDENKREMAIPRTALYGLWKVPDRLLDEAYNEGCKLPARRLMTRKPITAAPDMPVKELAEIMLSKQINRIPIVDGGKVVGIVSRADILKATCAL